MIASRLLSIMLLLQARGRLSATALARHFEVSVRTIYRDVDQLSAAGIPVFADRGRNGGFELTDGFRTQLTGLTQPEAETLFLSGLPGAAADLGLSDLLASAQLKLLAALPPGMPMQRIASRFHLDTTAWFHVAEKAEHLAVIARAVWEQRVLRMRYWRKQAAQLREVKPLGLVLKSGAWYLVARRNEAILTYRAANIVTAEALETRFEWPAAFDLAAYWAAAARAYEIGLQRLTASVRLSPAGWSSVQLLGPYVVAKARETAAGPDRAGWTRCTLPLESLDVAVRDLLRLGADVEVLDPPQLRAALAHVAQQIAARHRGRARGYPSSSRRRVR